MNIAVIGAGSWGTALANTAAVNGHDVRLWARRDDVVAGINENHRNPRYLVDAQLSPRVTATTSLADALRDADAGVIVTPSWTMAETARSISAALDETGGDKGVFPLVVCSKGIEAESGLSPIEVLARELGAPERLAALSGPNHAEEVVVGMPSGTVIASSSAACAQLFQEVFNSDVFRVYTSDDTVGVELCAAAKNVVAIAVGVSCGLGFGDNTTAMLMTRGLAEMSRLVVAAGGQALTCMGLAGAGDLIATCTSEHSRNRRLGKKLAAGGTLEQFEDETHMIAEGARACFTLDVLARRYEVELPITAVVRALLVGDLTVADAASALQGRIPKAEFWGMGK